MRIEENEFDHRILALLKQQRESPEKFLKKKSWLTIIYLYIYGLTIDPHNDQRPLGLIAQQVKNQTRIAEVRVRILGQNWIFQAFLAASLIALKCGVQIHSEVKYHRS